MSSADTKQPRQLEFDFEDTREAYEEATNYFIVKDWMDLMDEIGVDAMKKIIYDIAARESEEAEED